MSGYRWLRVAALLPLLALLAAVLSARPPTGMTSSSPAGLPRQIHVPVSNVAENTEGSADNPQSVTIASSFQSDLGCPGDWQPECENTMLSFDSEDDVWQGSFALPVGDHEYKAALNGSWDENYGQNATRDGPNIPLTLAEGTTVKFYYDHQTHWVTDDVNSVIAIAPGSYQSELGCPGDWQPDCLRSWLQDPDGDGIYSFKTSDLPAGDYEVKVAINESWDENYGAGGERDGPNIPFTVPSDGKAVTFTYDPDTHMLTVSSGAPAGNIRRQAAHWLSQNTIAWDIQGGADNMYKLHYAPNGGLKLEPNGVVGGESIALTYDPSGLSAELKAQFPHLADFAALKIPKEHLAKVPTILKGQIAVSAMNGESELVDAAGLQIPGVLDDLYTYNGELGVTFEDAFPTLRVWAPTAKSVTLHLYADPTTTDSAPHPMTLDADTGVWSVTGNADWNNKFYLYEVEVFVHSTGQVEHNLVTDPYSISLSMNSTRSQIVDLNHPRLKPAGWEELDKPELAAPEDMVIYELHVRDFSIHDPSVPEEYKGTFKAFTLDDSHGMRHLKALAEAGLTHIHLLPVFDIATSSINENPAEREQPDPDVLDDFSPDSEEQQRIVGELREKDAFNWGYDPFHFTTPEGSYSTNPDGVTRIIEFREMVKALNQSGLRVVMDVVYNHTARSGQDPQSVLDRIVPGYYHRLNPTTGAVETSTCCQNTATEHNMMEKLMIDSLVRWATAYKIDGFRFDLMGHHSKANMLKVRDTLHSLTQAEDGVDGSDIYIYGEGWNFGEVANDDRFVQATQLNMAGTGIGTFNDRIRDAIRGGGPFDEGEDIKRQGFINGLYYDSNDYSYQTRCAGDDPSAVEKEQLLLFADQIRVGLAGNLRNYTFTDRHGESVTGWDVPYNCETPTGYTLDPQETINYIAAHDNQTLFDAIQPKAPAVATIEERVRMQNMGNSLVALTQGIPFFHAGQDMLRSKSGDRDSYNSGDWFNKLDFTYESNNWGSGRPPAWTTQANWPVLKPLLADPDLKPGQEHILDAVAHFQEMLQVRKSSKLFRLETADEINRRVKFLNTGPDQIPGMIVMSLSDRVEPDLDPRHEEIIVLFNATDETQRFTYDTGRGAAFRLHPRQASSQDRIVRTSHYDNTTGTFSVPARTTAVFVTNRHRP